MTDQAPIPPHPTLRTFYSADAERQGYINDLFDRSSRDYDWINQVMSLGSGYRYRAEVLRRTGMTAGMRVLDVATGTGPVAAAAREIVGVSGVVIGVDPSAGMLHVAREKIGSRVVQSVGETLPFRSDWFDILTMGYALRHVSDLRAAFDEYRRVLKPGGEVVIMEISVPPSKFAARMLRGVIGRVMPAIARLGRRGADSARMMRYYWATTETCVPPDVILGALRDAGFRDVRRDLQWTVFAEYRGVK
ncbi:MAG TPA: class I SAM-dependent methyltransferase [Thermoanaerobaculia bacterium]